MRRNNLQRGGLDRVGKTVPLRVRQGPAHAHERRVEHRLCHVGYRPHLPPGGTCGIRILARFGRAQRHGERVSQRAGGAPELLARRLEPTLLLGSQTEVQRIAEGEDLKRNVRDVLVQLVPDLSWSPSLRSDVVAERDERLPNRVAPDYSPGLDCQGEGSVKSVVRREPKATVAKPV
jgi:hypothetical protein